MPRLQSFEVKVVTGANGLSGAPQYSINGFTLDFDEAKGGCGPNETLEAVGMPDSYPHSLVLRGPESGVWSIDGLTVTYNLAGETPYTLRFGPVELDNESDLNIWQPRPAPAFDV